MNDDMGLFVILGLAAFGVIVLMSTHASTYSASNTTLPGNYAPGEPTNFYNPSDPSTPTYAVPGGAMPLL